MFSNWLRSLNKGFPKSTRRRRGSRKACFRPWVEILEGRLVPSVTFNWHNRGVTSVVPYIIPEYTDDLEPDDADTPDNFNFVFGSQAEAARNVVDAALAAWSRVLTSFNDPENPSNVFLLTIVADTEDQGCGGGARTPGIADPYNGIPDEGTIIIDDCVPGGVSGLSGWFVDPTPNEASEFLGGISNPFAANPPIGSPANGMADLFSIVTTEMAHVHGISGDVDFLWQDKFEDNDPAFKSTGVNDANAPGKLWVYDAGGHEVLLTTNNGGANGTDTGFPVHVATPDPNHLVTIGSKTYFGAWDVGNGYGPGARACSPRG